MSKALVIGTITALGAAFALNNAGAVTTFMTPPQASLQASSRPAPLDVSYSVNKRLSVSDAAGIIKEINHRYYGGFFRTSDVLAVIQIESSFRPWVYRDEPQIGDRSIGLMQLLRSTAKDRGYAGSDQGLYDVVTNIKLGMAHLKWSYDYLASRLGKPPTMAQWISSYNMGVGNTLKGRINHTYIAKFNRYRAQFGGY